MFLPRSYLPVIFALIVVMVLVGAPSTALPVFTRWVALALPTALALPAGLPALWAPGAEPLGLWAANIIAAIVLILVVWRAFARPRGATQATRGRVWWRAVLAVALGLALANIVRAVIWSLYTGPSLTIYAGTVGISAALSLIVGALIGAVVGLLGAGLTPDPRTRPGARLAGE